MSKATRFRELHRTMVGFAKRDANYWHSKALAACAAGDEAGMFHAVRREEQAVSTLIRMISV